MRKTGLLILCVLINGFAFAQYRTIKNEAFKKGEKLTYRLGFHSALTGTLTAGRATLEIKTSCPNYAGRPTNHIVVNGRTSGFIELFYQVNDRFESFVDEQGVFPWRFERHIRENKYTKDDVVNFKHKEQLAVSFDKTSPIPMYTQDMISVFYYVRTFDFTNYKDGEVLLVPFFLDDSVYTSKIIYKGKKEIKLKAGKFNCIGLAPMVAQGKVFADSYPITFWVTDDKNHIPVFVEAKLKVGSARVELLSYEGLANSLTALINE